MSKVGAGGIGRTVVLKLMCSATMVAMAVGSAWAGEAGIVAPGTTQYPNMGITEVGRLRGELASGQIWRGAIDAMHGYAYLCGNTPPGHFLKVALGDGTATPSLLSTIELSESHPQAIAIDPADGFAYVLTHGASDPARMVKLALGDGNSPPRRLGALEMPSGDRLFGTLILDTVRDYGYFWRYDAEYAPISLVKVALGEGEALPRLVGDVPVPTNTQLLGLDSTNGYLYVSASSAPSELVKLQVGDGDAIPTEVSRVTLTVSAEFPPIFLVDETNGYGYLVSTTTGVLTKLSLGAGAAPPVQLGSISMGSTPRFLDGGLDPGHGYGYFDSQTELVKVRLGDGAADPAVVARMQRTWRGFYGSGGLAGLARGNAYALAVDPHNTLYDRFHKIALGDGDTTPTMVATFDGFKGDSLYASSAYDPQTGKLYLGTDAGQIATVATGDSSSAPRTLGVVAAGTSDTYIPDIALDAARGFGYALKKARIGPGEIAKFALNGPGEAASMVGSAPINAEEIVWALDNRGAGALALVRDYPGPDKLVKLDLGIGSALPTVASELALVGRPRLHAAFYDPASGCAYYLTGQLLSKYRLDDGGTPPVLMNETNLGADSLHEIAMDPAEGTGYFLSYDAASDSMQLTKIALGDTAAVPTVVSRTVISEVRPTEGDNYAIRFDEGRDILYLLQARDRESPFRVHRLTTGGASGAPAHVGTATFVVEPRAFAMGWILSLDPVRRQLLVASELPSYWGAGEVRKLSLANHRDRLQATKFTLWEAAATVETVKFHSHAAAGNLRLALYDNAEPRNLVWQSPAIVNTAADGDVTVPISSGVPTSLSLPPGTYWAAWQTDSEEPIGSYTAGSLGDGFTLNQAFGPAPATLPAEKVIVTDERWTESIGYTTASGLAAWVVF